jgi:hypothetical protein
MERAADLLYSHADVSDENIEALASAAVAPAAAAPASATDLVAMGFPRELSEYALRVASGRVELAADFLTRPGFEADAVVEAAAEARVSDAAAFASAGRLGASVSSPRRELVAQLPGQVPLQDDDESDSAGNNIDEGFDASSDEGTPEIDSGSNAAAAATPAWAAGADAPAAAHSGDRLIAHLVAMGFGASASRRACAATANAGVEQAAEWLLSRSAAQRARSAGRRGAASPQPTDVPAKQERPSSGEGPLGAVAAEEEEEEEEEEAAAGPLAPEAGLAALISLGFSAAQARAALGRSGGDADLAAGQLLEEAQAGARTSSAAEEHAPAGTGTGAVVALTDDERIVMAELSEREAAEREVAERRAAERAAAEAASEAAERAVAAELAARAQRDAAAGAAAASAGGRNSAR